MTTTDDTRPRRVVTVGTTWAVAYAHAKRDETDICQGSTYADDWETTAAQIVAVPLMLEALRAVVADGDMPHGLRTLAKRALKKAQAAE
jgi:hypothetical protein